ncbi:Protein kinase domain [Trypanosoma melophagium]|uniref:Protein kinase domain n=1 Tax=Trypanosoma melophagium TaxID=715481 RepID=UPI00351A20C5|nr:Protein kinase domain [Trypanosoma melophagium]
MGCGSSTATGAAAVSNNGKRNFTAKNNTSSTSVASGAVTKPIRRANSTKITATAAHRLPDKGSANSNSNSNSNSSSGGKGRGKLANANAERSPLPVRCASGHGTQQGMSDIDEDDDFDVRSNNGDMMDCQPLSSGALSNGNVDMPNLATFCNEPQECFYCHNAAVTHMCEQCESFYLCDECMFNDTCEHDPTHPISAIHETQSNTSRTFGSGLVTVDGGASSIFYDPCVLCGRVILDVELVYLCDECNAVVCTNCFQKSGSSAHAHELKPFQRALRTNAASYALLSKSRNSGGNKVINDYVVVKQLGRGSYAKVNLVQHRRERTLYALKILRRSRMNKTRRGLSSKSGYDDDDVLREIAVMKFVSHPNLVKLKEVIDDVEAQKVYVIMEYCEKGPIYVHGNPPLPIEKVRKYGRDIISGLLHLHDEYLFHRDIKPANCLVDNNDVVKIADFGACCSQMKNANTDGTPAYTSPEQCLGTRVTGDVVDSWAFAVTLYQISHGYLPVCAENFAELRHSLLGTQPLEISPDIDKELHDVLSRMLEKDFSKRLLLRGAAKHPFFGMNVQEAPAIHAESREDGSGAPNEELYIQAMKSVLRGKRIGSDFHGTRAIRKINRNELNYNIAPFDYPSEEQSGSKLERNEDNNEYCNDENTKGNNNNNNEHVKTILQETSNNTQLFNADSLSPSNEIDALQVVSMILETQKEGKLEVTDILLNELPAFLSDAAPRTTEFRLSNNGIRSVTNIDFSHFNLLREVSITNNALTAFPVEVLAAPRLQKLDLSHNRIVDIPAAVNRSRMLERLSLHSNCIEHVGVDDAGNSVLSGRCLRHVRLSYNPLIHLPEALPTCPNLELVLDDAPVLVEEWEKVVFKVPNVFVVWNDIYPRQVHHTFPLFIASKNIHLYKMNFLNTIDIKHVVLLQIEKWLPLGVTERGEMEECIQRNTQETTENTFEQTRRAGRPPQRGVVPLDAAPLAHSLPPILQKYARQTLKSYFVIADASDDPLGGFIALRDHIAECARREERVLLFLEEKRMSRSSREIAIGAICAKLREHLGPETTVNTCYQMVLDAMRGLYG